MVRQLRFQASKALSDGLYLSADGLGLDSHIAFMQPRPVRIEILIPHLPGSGVARKEPGSHGCLNRAGHRPEAAVPAPDNPTQAGDK